MKGYLCFLLGWKSHEAWWLGITFWRRFNSTEWQAESGHNPIQIVQNISHKDPNPLSQPPSYNFWRNWRQLPSNWQQSTLKTVQFQHKPQLKEIFQVKAKRKTYWYRQGWWRWGYYWWSSLRISHTLPAFWFISSVVHLLEKQTPRYPRYLTVSEVPRS